MTPEVSLALTVLAGAFLAAQARVNGSLGGQVGVLTAAVVSFVVGTVALAVVVLLTAKARAGITRLRGGGTSWWWWLGGLAGAGVVAGSAAGAPLIGVSLVGVCLVGGSTAGAVVVDRVGLGPGGRLPVTAARLLGAVLAIGAVSLGALGEERSGSFQPLLFGAIALAGFLSAGQQAANGQLQRRAADARVAALVSFLVGLAALLAVEAVAGAAGGLPAPHWPGNPLLYTGGLAGAAYIVLAAAFVARLGVLRLTLATVGGQLLGALLLDAVAPAQGHELTVWTVFGVVLTLAAVVLSGLGRQQAQAS